jgi:hypothetical protein
MLSLKKIHPHSEEEISSEKNHSDGSGRYLKAAAQFGVYKAKGRLKSMV